MVARSGTRSSAPRTRPGRYSGPPTYAAGAPRWGFPPLTWRPATAVHRATAPSPSAPALRRASWPAAALGLVALLAAAAEAWRFALLLRGRDEVLDGGLVQRSDAAVAATSVAALALGVLTAVLAVPALVKAHAEAAARRGRAPSRPGAAVLARLVVPGWNLHGAGQIVAEIDGTLAAPASSPPASSPSARPRPSRITIAWWLAWVANGVLVALVLARGFGGSVQAIADTVELHVAVDLSAAAAGILGAVMLRRFAAGFTGARTAYQGWQVQPPPPTRPLP